MAATKSLVSLSSRAALLLLLVALAAQTQMALSQSASCASELTSLNACAPFVIPGATNTNPSAECCGAVQSVQRDCAVCNTLRVIAQLPSQCNLPPVNCGN